MRNRDEALQCVWADPVPNEFLYLGHPGGGEFQLYAGDARGAGRWSAHQLVGIIIIPADDKILRFDDMTGVTWLLEDDDDGNPVWTEIKKRIEEK